MIGRSILIRRNGQFGSFLDFSDGIRKYSDMKFTVMLCGESEKNVGSVSCGRFQYQLFYISCTKLVECYSLLYAL